MDFHVAVPGPFTYLVQEHARSIIAIQELQQEVTSLLEFRNHVLEALPHLHARHFHSLTPAPTHDPPPAPRPAPPPTSRAEASPSKAAHHHMSGGEGGRAQRVGGGGGNSSSSSSTGGKSLSETHSSSAVADSGFSTDKAGGSMGKSSSSSAGEHLSGADDPRWTSVEPDLPLGSAEDELWQLLDVIQRKGTRLRTELERAERCERDRLTTGHHHHHHPAHPAAPASDPLSSPRHTLPHPRDYWPHSLPGYAPADLLPPPPPPPPPVGVALEAEAWAAVDRLRQDRQYLMGRVGWAEAEAAASHQRLVDLHGQLVALAGDKRRLEDQVRHLRLAPDPPITTAHAWQGGVNTVTIVADHTNTATTTTRPRRPSPAVTVSVAGGDVGEDVGGRGRVGRGASSVRLNTEREREVVLPRVLKVPIKERTPRPAAPAAPLPREAAHEEEGGRGSDRVVIERERRAGRADGGFSMPVSLLKGARMRVTPNKQRISAILREKDVVELRRQLLTTVMEAEVLRKQIEAASEEWAGKTSEWEADHRLTLASVTTLKEENTRLKHQLEDRPRPEHREVGVMACPATLSTGTMTCGGVAGPEEAPTHTVHAGPNVKYDVVVHQEERRGDSGARKTSAGVEKPPRRSREPRSVHSPAPPLRESAESPGGRDSLGRTSGARGRSVLVQSGRCTPTGTPRSSPASSITQRICTARSTPQETARASPLSRSASGTAGRSTLGRRDSLKAAQAKATAAKGSAGGGVTGQQKVTPAHGPDQGGVGQSRAMKPAPRTPLTLSDLRTPSPAPAAGQRGAAGRSVPPGRRLGGAGGLLHPREAAGTPSPRTRRAVTRGSSDVSSPQELRMSHLAPVTPSPSPPASYSSYYDSINSDGPLASPGPDRLMQVEVAFEWSPVSPQEAERPVPPTTQAWPSTLATSWPSSPRVHRTPSPSHWPEEDSLEAMAEFEAVEHRLARMTASGLARRKDGERRRDGEVLVRGGRAEAQRRPAGPAPRPTQDLNSRVHQILSRIASGGK